MPNGNPTEIGGGGDLSQLLVLLKGIQEQSQLGPGQQVLSNIASIEGLRRNPLTGLPLAVLLGATGTPLPGAAQGGIAGGGQGITDVLSSLMNVRLKEAQTQRERALARKARGETTQLTPEERRFVELDKTLTDALGRKAKVKLTAERVRFYQNRIKDLQTRTSRTKVLTRKLEASMRSLEARDPLFADLLGVLRQTQDEDQRIELVDTILERLQEAYPGLKKSGDTRNLLIRVLSKVTFGLLGGNPVPGVEETRGVPVGTTPSTNPALDELFSQP